MDEKPKNRTVLYAGICFDLCAIIILQAGGQDAFTALAAGFSGVALSLLVVQLAIYFAVRTNKRR